MEEERTHTARVDEHSETTSPGSEETSSGRRFIAGFATVGLALAAVVAIWSWQATGSDHPTSKGSAESNQEIASVSTGKPSGSPESSQTSRPDHHDHANLPSEANSTSSKQGKSNNGRGSGIAALGQDPYLPPNAWNGTRSGGFVDPTETVQLNPVNPVENGNSRIVGPGGTHVLGNEPANPSAPNSPSNPQAHQNNGTQNIPAIPGIPSEWVPTNLPLPNQPGNAGASNGEVPTGAPQVTPTKPGAGEDSGPTGNPAPGHSESPGEDTHNTTKPNGPTTAKPKPDSRPGGEAGRDWGSASHNGVTDTTEEN